MRARASKRFLHFTRNTPIAACMLAANGSAVAGWGAKRRARSPRVLKMISVVLGTSDGRRSPLFGSRASRQYLSSRRAASSAGVDLESKS
eukprot:6189646-Pleurochrysis_carterae.AAC.1